MRLERSVRCGDRRPLRGAGVQADDRLGLFACGEERVPRTGVQAGQTALGRQLREADRFEAAIGVAPEFLCGELRVGEPGQLQRDDPVGVGAGPDVEMPVVPGAQDGEAELGVVAFQKMVPAKPAISDGKLSEAQMPARSISAMRASISQQPRRISSNRAGSMLHSCLGRPMTALRPMLG